jgi:hypothetical protein
MGNRATRRARAAKEEDDAGGAAEAVEVESVIRSPRSGRQRKAWGVSPRSSPKISIEPAKRVIVLGKIRPNDSAAARFAGFDRLLNTILGLTPQALRCRPLRGLKIPDAGTKGHKLATFFDTS